MSQRPKRRRTTAERSDRDFHSQPATFVQPSQRNSQLSDEDLEKQIETFSRRAVAVMLNQPTLRPFTNTDILGNMPAKRKLGSAVIQKAKMMLFEVYGLKLVEVEAGKYIVCLPRDAKCRRFIDDSSKKHVKTFLAVTLSFISFHNGLLNQDVLLKRYMPKFFPDFDMENEDKYFGNVKDLLKELKVSSYLKEVTHENDVALGIGPRALNEFCIKTLVLPYMNLMLSRIPVHMMEFLNSLPE